MPEPTPPAAIPSESTEDASRRPQARISFRNLAISAGLSFVVLAAVAYHTYEPGLIALIRANLNPWIMCAALSMVGARILVGGFRLRFISRGKLNLAAGIRGQLAWDFFSNVTPAVIGGGPLAALAVARHKKMPVGDITGMFLFAMLLDQMFFAFSVPIILVAAFFLPAFPDSIGRVGAGTAAIYFVGLMAWVCFFGYSTLIRPSILEKTTGYLFRLKFLRRFRDRVMHEMRSFRARAHEIRSQPFSFFVKAGLITLVQWTVKFSLPVLIIWSIHPDLDIVVAALRMAGMTLGGLVMPTPGGSGGIEGLFVLFLGPLMPRAFVAPTLFAWRTLAYYIYIVLGAYVSMGLIQDLLHPREGMPDIDIELLENEDSALATIAIDEQS